MIMKSRVRKPSTKMQNAHTRKTVYTFLYFTTDLQKRPNRTDFSKPNRTHGFSQNRTELEKSIPHIPTSQHSNFVKDLAVVMVWYLLWILSCVEYWNWADLLNCVFTAGTHTVSQLMAVLTSMYSLHGHIIPAHQSRIPRNTTPPR